MKRLPLLLIAVSALSSLRLPEARAQERWPTAPISISDDARATEDIQTAQATRGAIPAHVDAPAYVGLDARRTIRIRPVGAGRVDEVMVSPGQTVHRGQVLFTYDDFSLSDETQRLLGSQAALSQAQALGRDARLTYDRGRALAGGVVSRGEVARRLAALQDAQGLVAAREAALRNEHERMARYSSDTERTRGIHSSVVSPIDGIVRHILVAAGEEVAGGALVPVEVDDLSQVWVISQVDEADAGDLVRGNRQLTWIRPDLAPIASHIDIIEGGVDPATRHVLIRSLIANADQRLRPDMLVRTRLFARDPVAGTIVPATAIQTIDDRPCVFVQIAPGRFEARRVVLGPALDGRIVLTRGLAPGDIVVARGSFVLKSQALLYPAAGPGKAG